MRTASRRRRRTTSSAIGEDNTRTGDPPDNPFDSLVGLVLEGNVEYGNVEFLVQLAQSRGGGVLQASDLGPETVAGLGVVIVSEEHEVGSGFRVLVRSATMGSVRLGRIPVPGAELIYDEQGSGEPLVLVHGTGAPASAWGGAVGDLAAGGYRVIAYDRRGYGRSVHRPVRDYRVHVADLAAVVEHVGAPAHVFGWSSGESTALALAVERPELCRCVVVLEATWHGLRYVTGDFLGAHGRIKLAQLRGRRREAAAIFFRWVSGLRDGHHGFDALPAVEREVLLANSRAVLAEFDGHPFGPLMEYVSTKQLAATRVPMIWLLGTETRSEWFRKMHSKAVRRAPNIQSDHIMGVGHFAHRDAPEDFAATVLRAVKNAS